VLESFIPQHGILQPSMMKVSCAASTVLLIMTFYLVAAVVSLNSIHFHKRATPINNIPSYRRNARRNPRWRAI
jgi:hypothetical protein